MARAVINGLTSINLGHTLRSCMQEHHSYTPCAPIPLPKLPGFLMLIHDPQPACSMLVHITIHAVMYNHPVHHIQFLFCLQTKYPPRWCILTGWGESADRKIILPSDIIVGCPLVCAKLDSKLRMTKSRFQKRKPKTLSDVLFQDNYPLLKVYEKTSNTNKFNLYITP